MPYTFHSVLSYISTFTVDNIRNFCQEFMKLKTTKIVRYDSTKPIKHLMGNRSGFLGVKYEMPILNKLNF
jgi:hypothetical protein